MQFPRIIYLERDSADLVCHCTCARAFAAFPRQLDCPWYGCGWLFTCIDCRKEFTFARGVELENTFEELAQDDLDKFGVPNPSPQDIAVLADHLRKLFARVEAGVRYVYLDGKIIRAEAKNIHFEGIHSMHVFNTVPQVAALSDPSILTEVLGSRRYWDETAPVEATGGP